MWVGQPSKEGVEQMGVDQSSFLELVVRLIGTAESK